MPVEPDLSPQDLARATAHGLSQDELRRQLAILRAPAPAVTLDRPCHLDDGVDRITAEEEESLLDAHERAASAGRATYFVPASGAATRMFKALLSVRSRAPASRDALADAPDDDAKTALRFFDNARRFAFADDLDHALRARGRSLADSLDAARVGFVLDGLLQPDGLGLAERPKGLIPFHRYRDRARTAFEEHLVEALALATPAEGPLKLHFTVSGEHEPSFVEHLERVRGPIESANRVRLEVSYSTQKSSTDTIAVDAEGRPFRTEAGELLFRPGGHGSLLANVADLARDGADLLFVKNIDNVVHDDWRAPVVRWRRLLAGRLVVLQERLFAAARTLEKDPSSAAQGADILRSELGLTVEADAGAVRRALHRPTRVCAVLRAEGDPGGGPFWVRGRDGRVSPQIVETAQIDRTSPDQQKIQSAATHFSPADMVLGLRDHHGQPYDLPAHVDPEAVFVAEKSSGGRALRALEHPGLWNGGMSDWNTLFVEVPPDIFHPVKTLTDLLEPAHQPAR